MNSLRLPLVELTRLREGSGAQAQRAVASRADPHIVPAGKPMFHLTSADGAIGAHTKAVAEARQNFSKLAAELLARCGIGEPLSIS